MSRVNIYINGKNARTEWGVVTTGNTLSALLAPAGLKERVSNESRLEHGRRTDNSAPRTAARELNLEIQMTARNPEQFYARHEAFCAELEKGVIDMYMSDRPTVVYHFDYNSCPQYTQFRRGMATLALKVTETNPKDRTAHDND